MHKTWPWITIIIFGILGIFALSRLTAPKPPTDVQQNNPSDYVQPDAVIAPNINEQTSPEPADSSSNKLPEGWQEIDGGDFTIDLPQTWFITQQKNGVGNEELLSFSSTDSKTAYANPNEMNISISRFSKTEKTSEQLKTEKIKNETDATTAVEFMKTNANPPFNEITTNDIKTSIEEITLNNNTVVTKNIFQCLKPCYIEGGANTMTQYFMETEKDILVFTCVTGVDEKADALRLVAEQIIKTFQNK